MNTGSHVSSDKWSGKWSNLWAVNDDQIKCNHIISETPCLVCHVNYSLETIV